MPNTEPSIYTSLLEPRTLASDSPVTVPTPRPSIPAYLRLRGILTALVCTFILLTAWHLEPSYLPLGPRSWLSFPQCAFQNRTGYPCPTCGMTTAWARAVRADLISAFRANIAGAVLAIAAFLVLLAGLATAVLGRVFYLRIVAPVLGLLSPGRWFFALLALIALAWTWNALGAFLAQRPSGS